MTVYVDDMRLRAQVGSLDRRWCHLFAGPFDHPDELHAFAAGIGLKRAWYQGPPEHRWPHYHYDVTDGKRAQAVAAGAVEITCREGARLSLAAIRAREDARLPDRKVQWTLARQLYERAVTEGAEL